MVNSAPTWRNSFSDYFSPPNHNRQAGYSVLYLLRRDAAQLFGYNPNNYNVFDDPRPSLYRERALWPGAMVVAAGIDLLGKFDAGTDLDQQPAGHDQQNSWRFSSNLRFQTFVRRYIAQDQDHVELIFQLRNALVHSFSLFGRQRRGNRSFRFVLAERAGKRLLDWRERSGQLECVIYLYEFHRRFELAVFEFMNEYGNRLESSSAERRNFIDLLQRYGFIGVGELNNFGW